MRSFFSLQVNDCVNVSSFKHPSWYHKCSLWEQLRKPRGDLLFSVGFMSATQFALLEAGSDLLAWAQVMRDEFSAQTETWSRCPQGLALRLFQEEWQEDDRYARSKLLWGGLSSIYCPQEPSPEFDADTLVVCTETVMYMCLVWTCPGWLHHCGAQLPWTEKKGGAVVVTTAGWLLLLPSICQSCRAGHYPLRFHLTPLWKWHRCSLHWKTWRDPIQVHLFQHFQNISF